MQVVSGLRRIQPMLDVLCAIAILATATVVLSNQLRKSNDVSPLTPSVLDVDGERIEGSLITNRVGSGRVALVEFGDYQCPYCGRHARDTYPQIMEELIAKGVLQYAFLHYPLDRTHPRAFRASEAAECAAHQGRFWDMHASLFAADAELSESALLAHATAIGVDPVALEQCLSGEMEEIAAKVKRHMEEGTRLGVRGTPTLFLGFVEDDGSIRLKTSIRGAVPFQDIKEAVVALAGESRGQG
jgi:protein-disulfide isomerase